MESLQAPGLFDADSERTRRAFIQCQRCQKSQSSKRKLKACTGCQHAKYCSVACQRAHWPAHRAMCEDRQKAIASLQELDKDIQSQDVSGSSTKPVVILPTEVLAEVRSFTQQFRPALYQAGYNCLDIFHDPDAYQNAVVSVEIIRLPDHILLRNSKPWTRWTIVDIRSVTMEEIKRSCETPEEYAGVAEFKSQQERLQRQTNGAAGTITLMIRGRVEETNFELRNMAYCGYGQGAQEDLEIVPNWKEKVISMVAKKCGRDSITL